MLVLVGAGSRYENQQLRGISHFLEHMFFKGANKYKNTRQVSEAIDSVGGSFNAFTGKEYAGYYVKVASDFVDVAADVLSDMLINAKFKQEEINKERGVILEELNMYQDTPMYQIGWDFENLIFGNQPLGWDQIGTKKLIKTVNQKDFKNYKNKLYTPDNTVIAVVGNISHEDSVKLVKKYFKMAKQKKALEFDALKNLKTKSVSLKTKKTEQAHLAVGFPGYSEMHKDNWVLKVLAAILGGNMSSRMFLNVRESQGLCYYVHTSTEDFVDGGILVTNAGVDLRRIDLAIKSIVEQYRLVRDKAIASKELDKAKAFLKGKLVLKLEDSEQYAHLLAKYELLHNSPKSPEQIANAIDAVTVKDLKRVAQEIIDQKKMRIAVIGPYDDPKRFEKLLKI